MRTRIVIQIIALLLALPWPGQAEQRGRLTVSAALSLKAAFEEIGSLFQARNPGTSVQFNFGASGALQRQIESGAPVDVFASASEREMEALAGKGLLLDGTTTMFVSNDIVLVVPADGGAHIATFADLASNRVRRVAIGTPATVPAGRYAGEVLRFFGIRDALREKLVYAENVRQVMDYVARKEVDAGVVFATDALTRKAELVVAAVAPEKSHAPALYPIAAVKGTQNEAAAKAFIAAVLSEDGKRIFRDRGFRPVP